MVAGAAELGGWLRRRRACNITVRGLVSYFWTYTLARGARRFHTAFLFFAFAADRAAGAASCQPRCRATGSLPLAARASLPRYGVCGVCSLWIFRLTSRGLYPLAREAAEQSGAGSTAVLVEVASRLWRQRSETAAEVVGRAREWWSRMGDLR